MPAVAPRARREVEVAAPARIQEIRETAARLRELLKEAGITEGLSTTRMTKEKLKTWVDASKCDPESPCEDDYSCYIRSKKGVDPPKGVCIPTGDVEDRLFRYVRNGKEFVGTRVAINALKRMYPEAAAEVAIAEEGPPPLPALSAAAQARLEGELQRLRQPRRAPRRRREISPALAIEEPLAVREPRDVELPSSFRARPRISSRRRRDDEPLPLRLRPIPEMGGMVEELIRPAEPPASPEAVRQAGERVLYGEPGYIPRRLQPLMRQEDIVIEEEEEPAPEDIADMLEEIREPAQIVVDDLSEVQRLALQCLGIAV